MDDKTYVLLDDVIAHIASCERSDMLPVECSAITLIKNIPAADVAPVRHGKWEYIGGYGYQFRCSECILCAGHKTNYCPNCGAKMDGDQDNE